MLRQNWHLKAIIGSDQSGPARARVLSGGSALALSTNFVPDRQRPAFKSTSSRVEKRASQHVHHENATRHVEVDYRPDLVFSGFRLKAASPRSAAAAARAIQRQDRANGERFHARLSKGCRGAEGCSQCAVDLDG